MRLPRTLIGLLLGGCDRPAPPPSTSEMVAVPAGTVELGPGMGPPPGAPPPGSPPPDSQGPPPPQPIQHQLRHPASQWTWQGGQALRPREIEVAAFEIDRTEVTRDAYKAFLDATGYRPPYVDEDWAREGGRWGRFNWEGTDYPPGTGDHPVVLVSWYDATEYCAWKGKRLPTEAEWQLAALGAGGAAYPWGSKYDENALNHGKMEDPFTDGSDGYTTTSPVGAFPSGASPLGLLDAFGNAWEFTSDFRVDDWSLDRAGPGLYVAVRGGSYFFDVSFNPAGERNQFLPEIRRKTSGFRCAR